MDIGVSPRVVSTPRVPTNYPSASTPPTARRDAADAHTQSSIYIVVSLTQVALTPSPRGSVLDVALFPPSSSLRRLPLLTSPFREHAPLTILELPLLLAPLLVALRVDDPLVF